MRQSDDSAREINSTFDFRVLCHLGVNANLAAGAHRSLPAARQLGVALVGVQNEH
jgi:hypothetical protein